jgi:hypothetical protein
MRREDVELTRAVVDEVTWLQDQVVNLIDDSWSRGILPGAVDLWGLSGRWTRRVERLRKRWNLGPLVAEQVGAVLAQMQDAMTAASEAYAAQPANLRVRAMRVTVDGVRREWSTRAQRIAVTETTRNLSEGQLRSPEAQRLGAMKLWVSSRDQKVRETHRMVDDRHPVPVTSSFLVGGHPMFGPGDPMGPPDEVINCRCELKIIPAGGTSS